MKKVIIFLFIVSSLSVSVFASEVFTLTKSQQNRLNSIVKQLKIPFGEYKLTVQSSGAIIENLIMPTPEIQVVEKEKIVTETKTIEVPKEVIVEKILPDPQVDILNNKILELENQVSTLRNQLSIVESQASAYRSCLNGKWSRVCGY